MKRYEDRVTLNGGSSLLLISYSGGAFTSNAFVNLEHYTLYKKVFLFKRPIRTFDNVRTGEISVIRDKIQLELLYYSGEKKVIQMNVKELLEYE